jgi:MFS family permease
MGQAMGYIAAATSIGSLAGPLLGGVVYANAGYYAVFAMGFAIIGLDIVLRFTMIEKSVAQQWATTAPPISSTTSGEESKEKIPGSTPSNAAQSQSQANQPSETENALLEGIEPLPKWTQRLPPVITLLRVPRILVSLLGCFVQSNALGAFDSVLPLYVKTTFHWTSTGAGLIFICLVIPALFSPIVGIVSDRFGSRTITTVGLAGALPFWVVMRFVTYDSIGQKVLLCALLFGIGTCMTFVMAPLMADLDHAVELEGKKRPDSFGKRGAAAQGFGLFNFAYAVGTLVGPLWATFVWTGGRIMLKEKKSKTSTMV